MDQKELLLGMLQLIDVAAKRGTWNGEELEFVAILRKGNISNIANLAFRKDSDAAKFLERLGQMIIDMDYSISEKVAFLRDFGRKNFIDAEKLFDNSGLPNPMSNWWTGEGIATEMFRAMINDPYLQGKYAGEAGPGEVAIAAFHRKVFVGTDPSAGYDLKYGKDEVEVKAKTTKQSGGGRWTSPVDQPLVTYASQPTSILDKDKLLSANNLLTSHLSWLECHLSNTFNTLPPPFTRPVPWVE